MKSIYYISIGKSRIINLIPWNSIILKKFVESRKEYLNFLIGMRIIKQGLLSLFWQNLLKQFKIGMKKNPKLWIRLIKSYKFNSNSQINKNSNCSNWGILSDAQLIERNITSWLSYWVKADDLKISRLQNALKTENFEVTDFETYYKMNSRISQVPENPELRVNEGLVAERTIAKRIIRLKSRNPVFEHYK